MSVLKKIYNARKTFLTLVQYPFFFFDPFKTKSVCLVSLRGITKFELFILGIFAENADIGILGNSVIWTNCPFFLNQKMNVIIDWINPYDKLECQCGTHWLRGLPSSVSWSRLRETLVERVLREWKGETGKLRKRQNYLENTGKLAAKSCYWKWEDEGRISCISYRMFYILKGVFGLKL